MHPIGVRRRHPSRNVHPQSSRQPTCTRRCCRLPCRTHQHRSRIVNGALTHGRPPNQDWFAARPPSCRVGRDRERR